uniref:FAD-binding protein n=1 Tax=Acidicapsa ligni TaxID=542300 RepID=UPI00295AA327|nr:FAD-binding protein [Acidicapsa ligni]
MKTSSAIATGALLSRVANADTASSTEPTAHETNWAGNLRYHADHLFAPRNVDEVQQTVRKCAKLRALGSRHSFNTIADSQSNQISLVHLDSIDLDAQAHTVTVGAGVRYGTLAPVIDAKGFAVHNLASLPHITVAGAIATATHGSGIKNGNLATAVRGLEIVDSYGNVKTFSREKDGEDFLGSVVALGALGIVTKVTLNVLPRFDMTQVVYRNLSINELEHNLETIMGSGYSVSLFTDWQNHKINQVWIKRRVKPGEHHEIAAEFYGAKRATENMHPIDGHSAVNCTEQMGVPGPWYERMPHFKMNFTPSSGAELQTEYFVSRDRGYEAIRAVEELRDKITPHLFITEIRAIAADNLWMSMAYKRDSLAIHFTWKPETPEVHAVLPLIEEKLAPFQARPHWAKVFTVAPERLHKLYEKMPDYKALMRQHDPQGKFHNEFVDKNVFNA